MGEIYTLRFIRLVCNRRLLAQGNQCPQAISLPHGCSQGDIGRKKKEDVCVVGDLVGWVRECEKKV